MKLLMGIGRRGARWLRQLRAKQTARAISRLELSKCLKVHKTEGEFLRYFRARQEPSFFLDARRSTLPEVVRSQSKEIIQDADEICAHNFDLLGSGKRNVDVELGRIDWHRDFKSGQRWAPHLLYSNTVIVKGNGSDIKVPWELSRFQHLPTLGKAYWLTGDEKYAREFVNEINDWVEANPHPGGVNWTCPMDIAIRAVNWLWGFCFFKDSPEIGDRFLLGFLRSLLGHGKHIRMNLERDWRGINGNHYLSDIVGLVYLGIFLPEFKPARGWLDFGVRELVREMGKQVYPDGVDYEGSISYHRLVTELFLSATWLCLKNGITFPDWYMARLEKMLEFVMYYTKPDGTAPQIGDNDDGRLHIQSNYGNWNRLDHRYLLSSGAVLFNRPDFKPAAEQFHEESFWLLGEEGLKKFGSLSKANSSLSSKALPQGGYYIMRKGPLYMIVDGIPADRQAPSGHRHNSRLSFELFAHDKSFIIDPGAYIYTADKEMRNLFRSTQYHNTVVIDKEEQNSLNEDELFRAGLDASVRVNKWETTESYDFLDVEHTGYRRLRNPVTHRRQIYFDRTEGYWMVKDLLDGGGEHRFDLYFHLAPLEIGLDKEFALVIRTKTKGANLAIIPLETDNVSMEIEEGWVSYRYGVKVRAPVIRYSRVSQTPASFCNLLYPYLSEIDVDKVKEKVRQLSVPALVEGK